MAKRTIEELVNDLKCKAQTLRTLEDSQGARLQEALRTGKYPANWAETDERILRLRNECAALRKRVMRRIETKSKGKNRRESKGSTLRQVAAAPPRPPLFPKQD